MDDELDMLVVNADTLGVIDAEHLAEQVFLHSLDAHDSQQVVRVDGALDELITGIDVLALFHPQAGAVMDQVGFLFSRVIVGGDDDFAALFACADGDRPVDFCQGRLPLGLPCLKQLLDPGKALRDILHACHAARMEGAHRQLRARLTDGLCGDDAHCFTDIHRAAVGEVCTVAAGAHAVLTAAGQHAADLHF